MNSMSSLNPQTLSTGTPNLPATIPAPPPVLATPAPAPTSTDRVTLQTADDGVRSYTKERDTQGVEYQTWQARSGAKYEVASDGQQAAFKAEVPAGILPKGIQVEGHSTQQGPAVVAHPAGDPSITLPTQIAPDGKILIGLAPNGPMAMFDPQTLQFEVATQPVQQRSAQGLPQMYQQLREQLLPDGTHVVQAHGTMTELPPQTNMLGMMTPGSRETQFIEIQEKNGQVSGGQVTMREPLQQQPQAQPQPQQPGFMGNVNGLLNSAIGAVTGGSNRSEGALSVAKQADGSFAVNGGDLMGQLKTSFKNSLKNPFAMQSPMMNWLGTRNTEPTLVKTFASDPSLLSAVAAAAGPAAAAAAAVPNPAPNVVPPPPTFGAQR